MEYVMRNFHFPGQIENWVTIINIGKVGITQIDKKLVASVIQTLATFYENWNRKTFILNATMGVRLLWYFLRGFITANGRAKINLTGDNTHDELQAMFHPN